MAAIKNHQEHLKNLVTLSGQSFAHLKTLVDYVVNLKDSQ